MPSIRLSLLSWASVVIALAVFLSACSNGNNNGGDGAVSPPLQSMLSARLATDADLLTGPLARGRAGDFVLENENLRVIIQKAGRQWLSIGTFGGNIIDVSRKDASGGMLPDHLEEFVLGLNIENTPNYTDVRIERDGSDGESAVICATGPDDLLELANASSSIRDFGASLPASADDRDLPVEIETCYTVEPGARYVTMDTTIQNQDSDDLPIYLTEYLNGSGQVEFFQPFAGFGGALLPVLP